MISSLHREGAQEISEIVPGKLYLGNRHAASDLGTLTRLGITHILNAASNVDCAFKRKFKYHKIEIEDGDVSISNHFDDAFDFIEKGGVVLVHCKEGISRSATIVIAYLMRKQWWDVQTTLDHVKMFRPIVSPHFLYLIELENYQKRLCISDIGKSKA